MWDSSEGARIRLPCDHFAPIELAFMAISFWIIIKSASTGSGLYKEQIFLNVRAEDKTIRNVLENLCLGLGAPF